MNNASGTNARAVTCARVPMVEHGQSHSTRDHENAEGQQTEPL
jgi:hypothetical protein